MTSDQAAAGSEFYRERLDRAAALPESQRSSDVSAWLHSHAVVEAAAAALPELPPGPGPALVEPLGGKPALAAVLQFLAHSFCHLPERPGFPCGTLEQFGPQLPPLAQVVCIDGGKIQLQLLPNAESMLASGGMPSGAADLEVTARMLLLALIMHNYRQSATSLAALRAVKPWLFDSNGAARLSQQLQLLQQEVTNSMGSSRISGSSGSNSSSCIEGSIRASDGSSGCSGSSSSAEPLPTVEQLQVVWHLLALRLAFSTLAKQQLSPATHVALMREVASGLERLQPGNPGTSFWLGQTAIWCDFLQPASVPPKPVPHFLHCVQLAREQGSDLWLARGGWAAATFAASRGNVALSPAQATALLAEADAAYQRCKAVVPPAWAEEIQIERKLCAAVRPTVAAHMQQSPQQWRSDVLLVHREGRVQMTSATAAKVRARPTHCDACGRPSDILRKCSACKGVAYCSTHCQKQHWPAHKAACKAARVAAGTSGSASTS